MRVLLAIDGSDCSKTAIELVARLPWTPGTTVRVLRAVEPLHAELVAWELVAPMPEHEDAAFVAIAEADVEATASRLRAVGLRSEHAVVRDRPATAIVEDATRRRPDLVIVGSHGYGALDRLLLGSVSAEVVDQSPVPVLVARRARLERAIVTVDGSVIAFEAVDTVARWPLLATAEPTVLSVIPVSGGWWRSVAAGEHVAGLERSTVATTSAVVTGYERFAAEGAARLGVAGVGASIEVRSGPPADEIIACARERDADLIVVGSHGRTGISRLVMGSVARKVLNQAPCSVLVVRRHPTTASVREVSHVLAAGLVPA